MASRPEPLHKVELGNELGKSTLVGNLNVSIPMPPGATPPPRPADQPQTQPAVGSQGSNNQGQDNRGNG
jgi:hypothetical protein